VHFLAGLEVRHVLLIDGDESAILRIATVPRRAVSYADSAFSKSAVAPEILGFSRRKDPFF
jgi:hypothetical protein